MKIILKTFFPLKSFEIFLKQAENARRFALSALRGERLRERERERHEKTGQKEWS